MSRSVRPPAARLAADRERLLGWRPIVAVGALIARAARFRAYALWPSVQQPLVMVDLGYPPASRWLQATFASNRRRVPDPATWNALRARGLLVGRQSSLALRAAERALGRPPRRPRLAIYSRTGETFLKANCFVFERGQKEPAIVIKMMPDRRFSSRLRSETEFVEILRSRVASESVVSSALPLAPLFAGDVDGDHVVVQALDPLAVATGQIDRATALSWLGAFQAVTTARTSPWTLSDGERELEFVRDAWKRARPDHVAAVLARAEELMADLHGVRVRRCAVHGDFWQGNLAHRQGRLRVYDWEWAELEGSPFFDSWMYELGGLRQRAESGEQDLAGPLHQSLQHVRRHLEHHGADGRFALAMLAPAVGLITFRERRATGLPGGGEESSVYVMAAVEKLLLSGRSGCRSQ
jgi:hypothetical protein